MRKLFVALFTLTFAAATPLWSAPVATKKPAAKKPAAAPKKSAPAKAASSGSATTPASASATTAPPATTVKQNKEGELDVSIQGQRKDKMTVGKIDPPAAFNLEDIQNFPEDRLQPVLNNTIAFEEGRDFSRMMDALDDKIIHPWLPEIPRAPFLTMDVKLDKAAKDWSFSVIDQGGTPVSSTAGKGSPPDKFTWQGDDKSRGHLAIDTVYIPQLSTTDKDGYRHTYMGHPAQFAAFLYVDKGRTMIELSSKRLFLENKAELSKEAPVYLEKVGDFIREAARVPFAIQAYEADLGLGKSRQEALAKYFSDTLMIPVSQIKLLEPASADTRGQAMAVTFSGTSGGE